MARKETYKKGIWGEHAACLALVLRGYRILGRRVKTPLGEIDIVARKGDVLSIVEVKMRTNWATAAEAIRPAQQKRLVHAARIYVGRHVGLVDCCVRFDAVLVVPWRWPRFVVRAWDGG